MDNSVWLLVANVGVLLLVAGLAYLIVIGRVRNAREEAESALDVGNLLLAGAGHGRRK